MLPSICIKHHAITLICMRVVWFTLQDSWRIDKTCRSSWTLSKWHFHWIVAKQLWSVSVYILSRS